MVVIEFVISTDSDSIKKIAEEAGANVPFIRPSIYSEDSSTMISVVDHALDWFENNFSQTIDYIVLLQPTTPFRESKDIDEAIGHILNATNANSLISCYDASHVHPSIMYEFNEEKLQLYDQSSIMMRRQKFNPVYVRNGCIYIVKREYYQKERRLVCDSPIGYKMSRSKSLNIDEDLDFVIAEAILGDHGLLLDSKPSNH